MYVSIPSRGDVFLPSSPLPFPLYSARHDGSRSRSYTRIRTRPKINGIFSRFDFEDYSTIILWNEILYIFCTCRNLINYHFQKRDLYIAHEIKVWTGGIDWINPRHSSPPPPNPSAKRNLVVVTPGKGLNGARRRVSRKEIVHFRHGTIDIIDEAWTSAASLESRETADLLWASGQRAATEPGPIFHPREHGLIIYERANARGTIDFTGEAN